LHEAKKAPLSRAFVAQAELFLFLGPSIAITAITHGGPVMLVLTRRLGEEIVINGDIRVAVVAINGDRVRLGISAPSSVPVDRSEIHERRAEFASRADWVGESSLL
jgi:carbon storage regulator